MWLIFSLLSALAAALVAIFGKIGLQRIDANAASAIRAVIMAGCLVGLTLLQGHYHRLAAIFSDRKALLFVALSGIAGTLSWLFYFWALKLGKVSQVAPIDKLSVVLATLLAVFFLGEKLTPGGAIGIALIAIGAVIVALS